MKLEFKAILSALIAFALIQGVSAEGIEIGEISHKIEGSDLHVFIPLRNSGNEYEKVTVTFNYIDLDVLREDIQLIEPSPDKFRILDYAIKNAKQGTLLLTIASGNTKKTVEISIQDSGTIIASEDAFSKISAELGGGVSENAPILMSIFAVFVIGTAMAYVLFTRQKTHKEKEVESAQKLLEQLEEIEKRRK